MLVFLLETQNGFCVQGFTANVGFAFGMIFVGVGWGLFYGLMMTMAGQAIGYPAVRADS